jgi:hypothetical protein
MLQRILAMIGIAATAALSTHNFGRSQPLPWRTQSQLGQEATSGERVGRAEVRLENLPRNVQAAFDDFFVCARREQSMINRSRTRSDRLFCHASVFLNSLSDDMMRTCIILRNIVGLAILPSIRLERAIDYGLELQCPTVSSLVIHIEERKGVALPSMINEPIP